MTRELVHELTILQSVCPIQIPMLMLTGTAKMILLYQNTSVRALASAVFLSSSQ